MSQKPQAGTIAWTDLTVPNADAVRDFYSQLVGWQSSPVSMGDYNDYAMIPPGAENGVAGICHARGVNAQLPPQWLIYIIVDNLEQRMARVEELGGKILVRPRDGQPMCVVQDPAGAVFALFAP